MVTTRSLSKRSSSSFGNGCGIVLLTIFGLIFGAVGFGVAYGVSGLALMNVQSARHWQPAQCEITFSQVTVSRSSDSDTSRIDIQYRYTWNDHTYAGKRYDFSVGSDNFNAPRKAEIVARHQPGQTVACFVNPADPTQSVIDRDMHWAYMFGLAFGTPFALVPVAILGVWLYARRRTKQALARGIPGVAALSGTTPTPTQPPAFAGFAGAAATAGHFTSTTTFGTPSSASSASSAMASAAAGSVVLKPETSRFGRVLGMMFLCLFWNGIVSVFTYFELTGQMKGAGWFLTLFLIPFQLIGVLMLWGVISSVLALANPKPTLTLSAPWVPVGGSLTLQWKMRGATSRLRNLSIVLCGREEAHYRRGTDSVTDKHTFHETQIVETSESTRIEGGMATISIPANTMHSFASDDNKIIWSLQVKGDIGFWPDLDETFELVVRAR
jgi:hypothetical protein